MRLSLIVPLTALALTIGSALADSGAVDRGQKLFTGVAPMSGRISGHSINLPPEASRCINCHRSDLKVEKKGVADPASSFAPVLNAETLTQPRSRRGGPPSRYDARSLCQTLRTGVDPVYIVMPSVMPRYEVSDDDCALLWAYLTRSSP